MMIFQYEQLHLARYIGVLRFLELNPNPILNYPTLPYPGSTLALTLIYWDI